MYIQTTKIQPRGKQREKREKNKKKQRQGLSMERKIRGLRRPPPELALLTQHDEREDSLPGTYLKDFRICVKCKRWCQAINNLGTLQCKFHPMVSDP